MSEQPAADGTIEHICPNCKHFYEHGKTEWEDAKECEDCTRRGGIFDNWTPRAVSNDRASSTDTAPDAGGSA